jgi:hypothetical protein
MVAKKAYPNMAQMMLDGFKMECEAAGRDWNVVLWVLKPI